MRKISFALCAVVLLACSAAAQAKAAGGGAEQALKDMETKWAAASLKSDPAPIAEMVAEDWTGVSPEGKVQTRADMLSEVKKSKLTKSAVSDMRVRMLDADAAVVTGIWSGAGTDPAGKKFDMSIRWIDVFVKKDGKWKCVSSQATAIAK